MHAPNRNGFFQHDLLNLPPGLHTVRISISEEKNGKSRDRFINFLRFEAMLQAP